MFISQAFAQTASLAQQTEQVPVPENMKVIVQIALIFIVIYFFLIRPQQKKVKELEIKIKGIVTGTQVVVGGILGKVTKIKNEDVVEVELATGVVVDVLRSYISQVLTAQDVVDLTEKKKITK